MNVIEVSGLGNIRFSLSEGGCLGVVGEGIEQLLRQILGMESGSGSISLLGSSPADVKARQDMGLSLGIPGLPGCFKLKDISGLMAGFYKNWHEKDFDYLSDKLALPEDKLYSDFTDSEKRKLGLAITMAPRPRLLILLDPIVGFEGEDARTVHALLKVFAAKKEHALLITGESREQLEGLCAEIISADKEDEA